MKKSKWDWLLIFFRGVLILGAIVFVFWYAASCADEAEAKASAERDEEDAELVRETEMRVWQEVQELMPPIDDIIMDALEPSEFEYCLEEGIITPEEAAEQYRILYNALNQMRGTKLETGG